MKVKLAGAAALQIAEFLHQGGESVQSLQEVANFDPEVFGKDYYLWAHGTLTMPEGALGNGPATLKFEGKINQLICTGV